MPKRTKIITAIASALVLAGVAIAIVTARCGASETSTPRGFVFPNVTQIQGIPVYNVATYGALGNGIADDTNAIRSAEAAANAAGGGIVYFPDGTYLLSEHNTTQRCLDLHSNVWLLGQSRGAILKMKNGVTNPHFVRMIFTPSNVTNAKISMLTLDGNKANNGDNEQDDAIFLSLNTAHVEITDLEIHDFGGDGITVHQNVTDVDIEDSYIHGNDWIAVALGNAGGQKRVTVRHVVSLDNVGGLHVETATSADTIIFEGNYVQNRAGNSAIEFAGGPDSTKWVVNSVARDNTVLGWVYVGSAAHITIANNKITNSDTSTGTAPHHLAAMRVTTDGSDILIQGNTIIETATGTALEALIVAGNGNDDLDNVQVLDNYINSQGAAQDGVYIQQLVSGRVERNTIVGNSGETTGHYGVNINDVEAPNVGNVTIANNYIADYPIGVVAQSGIGLKINNLSVTDNRFESITPSLMTAAMSLDKDGRHAVQKATVIGNDILNASLSTMFGTYPNIPMLIGGNLIDASEWSLSGTPEGTIAANIGSIAHRRDGSGITATYVKGSGTGNTGWLPAGGAVTTAGTNLSLTGQTLAVSGSPSFATSVTIGGQLCSGVAPTSVDHGTLGAGSTNCVGTVTGIGSNTSVLLTFGGGANATRSWCSATPSSSSVVLETIVPASGAGTVTFSCFAAGTGLAANCDDFNYYCPGQ